MNQISIEQAGNLTTDDFLGICDAMFDGVNDQKSVAAGLGISQQSVSNFKRGVEISSRSGKKIIASWNAFCDTGEAPKPVGLLDAENDDTGTRPFVAVPMARERDTGRIFRADQVGSGLIGNVGGPVLSDEEVVARIDGRFNVMTQILRRMLRNKARAMIVQAAAGVGKTHRIDQELRAHGTKMKSAGREFYSKVLSGGGVSAFALYKALWLARKNGIVVLDDNDSFLDADETLNMIKNALDTSDRRILTWSKRNGEVYCPIMMVEKAEREHRKEVAKEGDKARSYDEVYDDLTFGMIPNEFEFTGAMVFITNLDFKGIAMGGGSRAPHITAMIDRAFFVDLTIQNLRDKTLWCTHVFRTFMTDGLDAGQVEDICSFVADNATKVFSMSLRLFGAIAELASDPEGGDWVEIITATKFK